MPEDDGLAILTNIATDQEVPRREVIGLLIGMLVQTPDPTEYRH